MKKSQKSTKTAQSAKLSKPSQTNAPKSGKTAETAKRPRIDKIAPLTRSQGELDNLPTGSGYAITGANARNLGHILVYLLALLGFLVIFLGCYNHTAAFIRDWREFKEWQQDRNIGPVFPDNGGALEEWIAASLPANRTAEECAAVARVFNEVADMLDRGQIDTRAAACAETIARLQPEINPIVWNPFFTALYVRAAKDCGGNTPGEVAGVWRRIAGALNKAKRRAAVEALASAVLSAPAAVAVEDNASRPDSGADAEDTQAAGDCADGNCRTYYPYSGYGWRWF